MIEVNQEESEQNELKERRRELIPQVGYLKERLVICIGSLLLTNEGKTKTQFFHF